MHKLCTTYYVQQTTYYDVWRPYFKSDYLKKKFRTAPAAKNNNFHKLYNLEK